MKNLCLWDIDGTLSDDRHRRPYYLAKDWEKYFGYDQQIADPPYQEALALYTEMKKQGWHMGYLTARLERNRPATEFWLQQHDFDNPQTVALRPESLSHLRPAAFKTEYVKNLVRSGRFDEVVLIDNDPDVVEAITEALGSSFVFFAGWDQNPETRSLSTEPVITLI